jgi:segregation and condensation protein B
MSEPVESTFPVLEEATATDYAAAVAEPSRPPLEVFAGGDGRHAEVMPSVLLRRILEAVLFATDRAVSVEQLLFAVPGCEPAEVERELQALTRSYEEEGRGFQLFSVGGGYQLRTDPGLHEYVVRFLVGKKRSRLSRAAMETLAIVAYRQPITRGEMEEIRGVDCGQVLHTLLERNLVTIRGRSQALGRPLLYGTTEEFLHYFGINSMADLPSPEELGSLLGDDPLRDPELRRVLAARGLIEEPADAAAPAGAEAAGGADEPFEEAAEPELPAEPAPGPW